MSQPGWYPDPGRSPAMRWWDGNQWTEHLGPPPPPNALAPGGPLDPRRQVDDARTGGRRARAALIAGAVIQIVLAVTMAVVYSSFFTDFFREIERSSRSRSSAPPSFSGSLVAGSLVLNVVQIGSLVVGVLFIVWSYQAARAARTLGIPARLES